MKKIVVASLLLVSSSALANPTSGGATLVGNWLCEAVVYHGNLAIQTKNRVHYQSNGRANETIQVNHYENGELRATGNVRLGYGWELLGGRQRMSNMTIDAYEVYDHVTKQSANFGEVALLKQNLIDQYQTHPWQTITFIDENMHQYTADDGATGICLREVAP
ncbi:hypothetical protein [Moraxella oblonga]|uniref:hypothetical protein n=1 Tax=Moraxella oblonga TaxID=200413 RepID=UPI000835E0F5|nr:hypothetical protein [Moraxella oblonga]